MAGDRAAKTWDPLRNDAFLVGCNGTLVGHAEVHAVLLAHNVARIGVADAESARVLRGEADTLAPLDQALGRLVLKLRRAMMLNSSNGGYRKLDDSDFHEASQ